MDALKLLLRPLESEELAYVSLLVAKAAATSGVALPMVNVVERDGDSCEWENKFDMKKESYYFLMLILSSSSICFLLVIKFPTAAYRTAINDFDEVHARNGLIRMSLEEIKN